MSRHTLWVRGKRKMWRFLEHKLLEWVEARETDKKRPPTGTIEVSAGHRHAALWE
jgi:hypothetical protein